MKKLFYLGIALCLFSCGNKQTNQNQETSDNGITLLSDSAFNKTVDGKQISLYTLKSTGGLTAQITNFGGAIVSLWVADKEGKYDDISIGHANIEGYMNPGEDGRFFGPVVGRFANRIAKGKFAIDGTPYQLPINNNGQTLHGGLKGLDLVVWNVDSVTDNSITLSYLSPDGEEGFPGNLNIKMVYTLTADNEFKITYEATTDKPTVVNLSNHGLYNLKGQGNGTILDHILTINASNTTPVDEFLIPTGELANVEGTPFDFRTPTAIGDRIDQDNAQLKYGAGYDHNWAIDRKSDSDVEHIATLYEPTSGRVMEVWTDQPGLQFYSGNFFNGKVTGKCGKVYNYREALALETQKFPDSPNRYNFPSTRLNPGETYTQTCIYKFSVK